MRTGGIFMRKFIPFFLILMVIGFLTPNLFLIGAISLKADKESGDTEIQAESVNNDKIKLLLTAENKIIELSFDDYIKGVLIR
jgi:hypothetical protein